VAQEPTDGDVPADNVNDEILWGRKRGKRSSGRGLAHQHKQIVVAENIEAARKMSQC